jgi:hypothetical protein
MGIILFRTFFLWCTIINAIILIGSSLVCVFARDWLYPIHNRIFNISRETLSTICYSFIALYKMLWIVFNLVPWLALLIIA